MKDVLALGFKDERGHIVVTDVLCVNFPALTPGELADISWKLSRWAETFRRHMELDSQTYDD